MSNPHPRQGRQGGIRDHERCNLLRPHLTDAQWSRFKIGILPRSALMVHIHSSHIAIIDVHTVCFYPYIYLFIYLHIYHVGQATASISNLRNAHSEVCSLETAKAARTTRKLGLSGSSWKLHMLRVPCLCVFRIIRCSIVVVFMACGTSHLGSWGALGAGIP